MDRFQDRNDEEPELFSNCCSCDEVIRIGDLYIEYFSQVACDEFSCVLKMVGAERRIAEEDV